MICFACRDKNCCDKVPLQSLAEKGTKATIDMKSNCLKHFTLTSPSNLKLINAVNSSQKIHSCERSYRKGYHSRCSSGISADVNNNTATILINSNDNKNYNKKESCSSEKEISSKPEINTCKNKIMHDNKTKKVSGTDIEITEKKPSVSKVNKQCTSSSSNDTLFPKDKAPRRYHSNKGRVSSI